MIYIKTDMTECLKTTRSAEKRAICLLVLKRVAISDAHCFYRETTALPKDSRPLWVSACEKEDIK